MKRRRGCYFVFAAGIGEKNSGWVVILQKPAGIGKNNLEGGVIVPCLLARATPCGSGVVARP